MGLAAVMQGQRGVGRLVGLAQLPGKKQQPRLVVPQAALQVDQAGYYVMVVNGDNKVEQRRVTVGPNQGLDAVIQSGLKEGEKVIVEGVQKVRPGQLVKATLTDADSGS